METQDAIFSSFSEYTHTDSVGFCRFLVQKSPVKDMAQGVSSKHWDINYLLKVKLNHEMNAGLLNQVPLC